MSWPSALVAHGRPATPHPVGAAEGHRDRARTALVDGAAARRDGRWRDALHPAHDQARGLQPRARTPADPARHDRLREPPGQAVLRQPQDIYEELRRSGAPYTAIWSYAKNPAGFPKDARLVRRGSWHYYLALARAGFWVDNQGFPRDIVKRPQTTYIQTWHGSAYKRMGFDEPQVKRSTKAQRARFQRTVDRYDAFLIRSEHDARTLAKGLGVRAELIRSGYPRNDALVNGGDTDELARTAERLTGDGPHGRAVRADVPRRRRTARPRNAVRDAFRPGASSPRNSARPTCCSSGRTT